MPSDISNSSKQGQKKDSVDMEPSAEKGQRETMDSEEATESNKLSFTSRLSIQKFVSVIVKFDDIKRDLVKKTGFGGTLELPNLGKLNLRFSAWIMSMVDVDNKAIVDSNHQKIPFSADDVHKVFGIPCSGRAIDSDSVDLFAQSINFFRCATGMSDGSMHSLKAVEQYMLKDINENTSSIEKMVFQIAYVIFVMGHILDPNTKHEYSSFDFWLAVKDPDRINQFNWSEYVLDCILKGVQKYKQDMANSNHTTHLVGCHLFLQIIYLDNANLGQFNMEHNTFPRIRSFQHNTIKKMVQYISSPINPDYFDPPMVREDKDVCYTRQKASIEVSSMPHKAPTGDTDDPPRNCSSFDRTPTTDMYTPGPQYVDRLLGPVDFANHLRTKYPSLVADELTMLLKEHNSRCILSMAAMRNSYQLDMIRFADKLIPSIARRCKSLATPRTMVQNSIDATSTSGQFKTPSMSKICGRRLDLSYSEGADQDSSTGDSLLSKKRCLDEMAVTFTSMSHSEKSAKSAKAACTGPQQPIAGRGKPSYISDNSDVRGSRDLSSGISNSIDKYFAAEKRKLYSPEINDSPEQISKRLNMSIEIQNYAKTISATITLFYENIPIPDEATSFGKFCDGIYQPYEGELTRFAMHPLASGSMLPYNDNGKLEDIANWIAKAPTDMIERTWIVHENPRRVHIRGLSIRQRFLGSQPMEHELCSVLFRRLSQNIRECNKDSSEMIWCKILEPDFATHVLAGEQYLQIESIVKQFCSDFLDYKLSSCRLIYVPVILQDSCTLYMWDMINKCTQVLDPTAGPYGFSTPRVLLHEVICLKLHKALFSCINKFYSSWHCSNIGWSRKFPIIMVEKFSREYSGMCIHFFVKHYDGDKLVIPLNKENYKYHLRATLLDILMIEDNLTDIPAGIIGKF